MPNSPVDDGTARLPTPMTNPTSRDQLTAWLLVAVQASLIAAAVMIPRRPAWSENDGVTVLAEAAIWIALALGVWGALHLGRGLTPLPLPNGAVELVTRGPFRWIRHPLYSAVILGISGIALRSRTPTVIVIAIGLTLFLGLKARWEEQHLRTAFVGYAEYATRTGRFIPGVGRVRS